MKIAIEGMHCEACVRRVATALTGTPGVAVQDVTIGSAVIEGDAAAALDAIRKAGYEPRANT